MPTITIELPDTAPADTKALIATLDAATRQFAEAMVIWCDKPGFVGGALGSCDMELAAAHLDGPITPAVVLDLQGMLQHLASCFAHAATCQSRDKPFAALVERRAGRAPS